MEYSKIYREWYDEITLRKALPEDLPAMVDYYRRAVRFMNNRGVRMWDDLYPTKDDLEKDIAGNNMYIAEHKGKAIAAAVINCYRDPQYDEVQWEQPESSYMVIHRMCIDPEYTGMGLGDYMLYHCERMISERGYNHVRLDTFHKNYPALKLYSKFGYKVNGGAYYRKGFIFMLERCLNPENGTES